jgi:pilus assembly protein CpaE
MSINVGIVDKSDNFINRLKKELEQQSNIKVAALAYKTFATEKLVKDNQLEVIIFGPHLNLKPDDSHFLKVKDDIITVVFLTEDNLKLKKDFLNAGTNLIIEPATSALELAKEIAELYQAIQKSKTRLPARTITVFSTKGGVGKTFIASNLAIALADSQTAKVVIADLDLQFGDIAIMLNLKPKQTIYDLLHRSKLGPLELEKMLTSFNPAVKVLAAPLQPELADLISVDLIASVIRYLKDIADFLIIDTPPCFSNVVLCALDNTDELLLVTTLDLPAIKNMQLCLQTLKLLKFPQKKIKLILNRVQRNVHLTVSEVESSLKIPAWGVVPEDKNVSLSINEGVPLISSKPKSAAAKAIRRLRGKLYSYYLKKSA